LNGAHVFREKVCGFWAKERVAQVQQGCQKGWKVFSCTLKNVGTERISVRPIWYMVSSGKL